MKTAKQLLIVARAARRFASGEGGGDGAKDGGLLGRLAGGKAAVRKVKQVREGGHRALLEQGNEKVLLLHLWPPNPSKLKARCRSV